MGIRFIIGRAGSGKSKRCFDHIGEALGRDPLGPAIFWVLPRQLTFSAERELTCAPGIKGFCRAHVVSFEQLGREVLEDCGGSAVPQVTDVGRQMILGHLLRKHQNQLRYFRSVARQSGLATELDATFGEFERCGKSSSDLQNLLADLESTASADHQDQSLLAKLHDLRLLYDEYCAYLGQERLDPHRRLAQVLQCIAAWERMRGADVYIDGFLDFSDYERRMIAAMAKACRSVEITMLLDPLSAILQNHHRLPDELNPFYRTEDAYCRLWFTLHEEGIEPADPIVLPEPRRFENPALNQVEKCFLSRREASQIHEHASIALIEAPDRRAEVDAAARQVRAWLQADLRYRHVAVLVRDLSDYAELIDASFREHGIPHFIDRRRTAAHHPLLQFTRAVFLIALQNWPHDAVMTVIKSGLSGLSFREADELENYALLHRLRGGVWVQSQKWDFRRVLTRGEEEEITPGEIFELDRIDKLRRRVVDSLLPFVAKLHAAPSLPIRQMVVELFKLYETLGVRSSLLEWMRQASERNEIEQHDEHVQVWANLIDLLDQMVDLLGDESVNTAEFLEILEFGLERFDLALTPPTVDQVLVGAVDRTRNPQSRAVILLGMNQGQFPRIAREDTILSDGERRALRQRQLDLDPDTQRKLLDENLLAYIGLTRASHHLTLMRAIADEENRPQAPSPYWDRLRELFPKLQPQRITRGAQDQPDCIATPRQLVTQLMRWVRANPQSIQPRNGPWPALYQWLAKHQCRDDAMDVMRRRAWRALSYTNQAALSSPEARKLFAAPLHASVSRLETFAACPFRHFLRYGLQLEAREEQEVTALDLGNVYHEVLEQIVREMVKSKRNWTDIPPAQRDAAIKMYAKQVGETLRGELMLSSARNKYLLQRIEKTLSQIIATHEATARRARFRPLAAELGFGLGEDGLPAFELKTPKGREVLLHGKIDRIDLLEDEAAFAVIDYKLRGDALELARVYHGLSLQLLTYLLVVQASGQTLAGRNLTPAAAFYVRLMRTLESVAHPQDALPPDSPLFDLQDQPRGILDGHFAKSFDGNLDTGRSELINVHLNRGGGFGHKGTTDVAEGEEFAAMLRLVERTLGRLADQILDGKVEVAPYRMRQQSPCARCEFRSVCRFDVMFNSYNPLEFMGREQVLARAVDEVTGGVNHRRSGST